MTMKHKLSRMKQHMGMSTSVNKTDSMTEIKKQEIEQHVPFLDRWQAYQTKPIWFEDQYTLIRETEYSLSDKHGRYSFSQLHEAIDRWQDHLYEHPLSSKGQTAYDLLFFDTETTGLSSGVGNTIFLLGYCQMTEKSVRVKQYFLPGPESEVALYHHFLTDVGKKEKLVTYNGKAFDWPQVKTRHTFVRDQVPKLPKFGHFDLLHASRRLWKNQLPSCKLTVVEKEILQFERSQDTPSYLVPILYFDFLQEPDPDFVKGVFKHHEWDVLSLMTLYTHLSNKIIEVKQGTSSTQETFEIARWYEAIGESEIATQLFEQLKGIGEPIKEASSFSYAQAMKKIGNWEVALISFEQLIQSDKLKIEAAIECAKLYEHKKKDYEKALFFTKVALSEQEYIQKNFSKEVMEIKRRMERLELKLAKK